MAKKQDFQEHENVSLGKKIDGFSKFLGHVPHF
jgi:hypothetical protein